MTWEWLAPVGTIVGASITAGIGGWLGGRRSRKDQEAQHRFEREQALTEHGRVKVDDAIAALRFLSGHTRETAEGDFLPPNAQPSELADHYERLGRAIPYLADVSTRSDIELVLEIITNAWAIEHHTYVDSAPRVVWRACQAGLAALGRYLRGDPWETSEDLEALGRAVVEANEIQEDLYQMQQTDYRKMRHEQAQARKAKPEDDSPAESD